jgi:hypothetical protein
LVGRVRLLYGVEATVAKRTRGWLAYLGEVAHALLADPLLLAPALLVIVVAALGAALIWHVL